MLFKQFAPFLHTVVYLPLGRDTSILFVSQVSEQRGRVPRTGRCLAFNTGLLQLSRSIGAASLFYAADGMRREEPGLSLSCAWTGSKSRARPGVRNWC